MSEARQDGAVTARVVTGDPPVIDLACQVAVIGGGACGLTAAIWARRHGADEVLVLERDASSSGSTALSSGFVPAAGTSMQRARGIDDSAAIFASDIDAKAHGSADRMLADLYTTEIAGVVETLARDYELPFAVIEGFLYPGHSAARMHTLAQRTGAALVAGLLAAAAKAQVDCVNNAHVQQLFVDGSRRITALGIARPDGRLEYLGCDSVILACNGFGGNPDLVARYLPHLARSLYFGHAGNQGDAIHWGEALGAVLSDMTGYQGHGSVATPHGILLTWALMMKGGLQINREGRRFWNEHHGYSEAAEQVLAQPDGIAWAVYDQTIHRFAQEFPDYRDADAAGAIREAADVPALAALIGCPPANLHTTLAAAVAHCLDSSADNYGRRFDPAQSLVAPFRAARITGALFHTQGGLAIDRRCRVQARQTRGRIQALPNLFAAGGAARGVSGNHPSGYLSGNGLLSALAGGAVAGREAARRG